MSTELMLQKLRKGDYFCALEWLSGFTSAATSQDELLPRAIYELISHDFQQSDVDYIQMLNAIDKMAVNFPSVPGKYFNANMTLFSAALICLVYLDHNLKEFYRNKPEQISISEWMHRDNEKPGNEIIKEEIGRKMALFEEQIPSCYEKLTALQSNIVQANTFKTICDEYHQRLRMTRYCNPESEHYQSARLGVLAALCDQLSAQIMFTETYQSVLEDYVEQIRQLKPDFWEESYLRQLQQTPTTWLQNLSFFTQSQFARMLAVPGGLPQSRSDPGLSCRSYDKV